MSVAEAAKRLGAGVSRVHRRISDGSLRASAHSGCSTSCRNRGRLQSRTSLFKTVVVIGPLIADPALSSWWNDRIKLDEQAEQVADGPAAGNLPINDLEHADTAHGHVLAGSRDPE